MTSLAALAAPASSQSDAHLVCRDSGQRWPLDSLIWRSPAVATAGAATATGLLDIDMKVDERTFPKGSIASRPWTMWRYREAIPVPVVSTADSRDANVVSLGEGMTPLVPLHPGLASALGESDASSQRVLLKLDTLFPSGSYKDRGASVVVSMVQHLRRQHVVSRVVEDSSGNAGASFAMYCAAVGLACDIYVPEATSPAKLIQVEASGARLVRVPGTRQDTSEAVWSAAQQAYYVSHAWNPWFFQGTKTFAFEVCEQLGWTAPDAVVIPTGNGTLLLGAWIGFAQLRAAGVISRVPRLIAVQARACAPLALPGSAIGSTLAEGIAIANPIRAAQCRQAVAETSGIFVTVDDSATVTALKAAMRAGLCIEPTCATALACLPHLKDTTGTIVVALTGHGLKASATIGKLLHA